MRRSSHSSSLSQPRSSPPTNRYPCSLRAALRTAHRECQVTRRTDVRGRRRAGCARQSDRRGRAARGRLAGVGVWRAQRAAAASRRSALHGRRTRGLHSRGCGGTYGGDCGGHPLAAPYAVAPRCGLGGRVSAQNARGCERACGCERARGQSPGDRLSPNPRRRHGRFSPPLGRGPLRGHLRARRDVGRSHPKARRRHRSDFRDGRSRGAHGGALRGVGLRGWARVRQRDKLLLLLRLR
ncbi:hypothetical protein T484DRAFT_2386070 [Baffinella frigidus]|nr:hypothetical protein T484DRAFT_2386070 [Cryptophyta sp. CCMP2293]